MRLAKRIFRVCLYMASAVVLFFLIEGIYFYHIIQRDQAISKADAIVVFAGIRERVEAGYKLAGQGFAPHLIISSADSHHLATYLAQYGLPESVTVIREDQARTTFENAFYSGAIIRKNRFRSIILVSSLYHLPRALFLCRTQLLGRNVAVQLYSPPADGNKLWTTSAGRKLVHREMMRFWGSLSELIYCKAAGAVPEKNLKDYKLMKWLRSLFAI